MMQNVLTITMNPSIDKTILLEKFQVYGLNRIQNARLDPGGKGINVARVLKNFHVNVTVSGLIAGQQGKLLLEQLKHAGIQMDFMEIEGETRTNLKIVDESVNKTTEINESGFTVSSDIMKSFLEKLETLAKQASIVILGGSLPPGLPTDFYAQCITIAKEAGAKVLLDADDDAFAKGLEAVPYAVKPNIHELEAYFQEKFESHQRVAEAAQRLLGMGIEIVIVSMGSDGAIVADHQHVYKVDSWDIPIKSTVGAGDSMVGALAYSILKQDSLYEIARITTAAGTITASKSGTQICELDEVQQALVHVNVKHIR